jgi:hypothetical protein
VIVYGTSMYGKVDEVEGFCWTATQFAHIYWIPLIPTGSYIVTGEDGDGIQGLKVGLNGKSVGVAYLQGLCIASLIGCLIGGISTGSPFAWGGFVLALGTFIGMRFIPAISTASWKRAQQYADELDLVEEARVILGVQYGRIDQRTAEKQLQALAEQREAEEMEREARKADRREALREKKRQKEAAREAKAAKNKDKKDALRAKAPKRRKSRLGRD